MRYWDASALVPLVVAEAGSQSARKWLTDDPTVVTWAWTRIEVISSIERRTREGSLSREKRRHILRRFRNFADTWNEVTEVLAVRTRACALLARHPLRAADAAQLGAALLVNEQLPAALTFVSLDKRLSVAAEKEGLRILQ